MIRIHHAYCCITNNKNITYNTPNNNLNYFTETIFYDNIMDEEKPMNIINSDIVTSL